MLPIHECRGNAHSSCTLLLDLRQCTSLCWGVGLLPGELVQTPWSPASSEDKLGSVARKPQQLQPQLLAGQRWAGCLHTLLRPPCSAGSPFTSLMHPLQGPGLKSFDACRWSLAPASGPLVSLPMPCSSLPHTTMHHVAAASTRRPQGSCSGHTRVATCTSMLGEATASNRRHAHHSLPCMCRDSQDWAAVPNWPCCMVRVHAAS